MEDYPVELSSVHVKTQLQRVGPFGLENLDRTNISSIEKRQDIDGEARSEDTHVKLPEQCAFL